MFVSGRVVLIYTDDRQCFKYIVNDPPRPLSEEDIWFQIGHVYEQQKEVSDCRTLMDGGQWLTRNVQYDSAKSAYMRVLDRDPNHAKVLQQLGWLHHQQSTSFSSQEQAIEYLEKSVNSDQTDAQSWYLLGRCYMSQQKYPKAYEAYQQAVYRDGRNPTFWCSIGVLYYQINQYRDALDAYSRAIRLNPNISEVWYDLGTLYESCNNQTNDALDAYSRAAELDPSNVHIKARLALLKGQPTNGLPNQAGAPLPQDVPPQAYQPGALGAGPPAPQWGAPPPGQAPNAAQPPLPAGGEWPRANRLADLQNPQNPGAQPQMLNPYDSRDRLAQHVPTRQPTPPKQEVPRQFQEQQPQRPPPPAHRGLSPSPKVLYNAPPGPAAYPPAPGTQTPSQLPQPLPQQQQPPAPPNRIANPNYAPQSSSVPPPAVSTGAPPPAPGYPSRMGSPPEIRPILDSQNTSPNTKFGRQPFEHHPTSGTPSIAGGAIPPNAALQAAEAAAREREDRPSTAPPKRHREWEDDASSMSSQKKPANDESRSRLEDPSSRRASPPDRMDRVPNSPYRSPSEVRRADDQRRATENYHPSEAAHHPPALGPPQIKSQPQPSPRIGANEERRDQPTPAPPAQQLPPPPQPQQQAPTQAPPPAQSQPPPQSQAPQPHLEPAARKMDMDEDYDDSGDDEKRPVKPQSERNSPKASNGANHDG